jgi:hypothetical protein
MNWVDREFLQILSRHTLSVTAAILAFWFVAWLAKRALGVDSLSGKALDVLEQFVLLGLVIWLIIVLGADIWKRRPWNGGSQIFVLA